jgi:hypothetical protein
LLSGPKKRTREEKKRDEKLEELVSAVYEFDHWLDQYGSINAYGNPGEIGVSPLSKLEAIAAVYFPDFLEKIFNVRMAASDYKVAITRSGEKRLTGKTTEINVGLMDAYKPYALERDALLDELKKFAARQLGG